MIRAPVNPRLLRWARERSGREALLLERKFPQLPLWERGETAPTLKQLERFALATHTPVGYLFLPEPPVEQAPIPDLRTVGSAGLPGMSPDLLDTLYLCQQRQEWYRDYARSAGDLPRSFVGSARMTDSVETTARRIREALGIDLEGRRRLSTWTAALRQLLTQAEELGILVMVSGIVRNDTHRPLDPDEFRGFAMADGLAPLVFVNGADTKAAQMFTLAHEIAHLWLGESGVSDTDAASVPALGVEQWCNRVAAEILVPLEAVRSEHDRSAPLDAELARLARTFKVSTLVILRRLHDVGALSREQLREAYEAEVHRLLAIPRESGGNFYLTQAARVGRRFAQALVTSTLEGQTLHRDAFRLLGISKLRTFREFGRELGLVAG